MEWIKDYETAEILHDAALKADAPLWAPAFRLAQGRLAHNRRL